MSEVILKNKIHKSIKQMDANTKVDELAVHAQIAKLKYGSK